MNLLDRKSGLILLALLFFLFSCEDPTGNGEITPRDKVGVHYEEITLSSSIILTDSIVGFDTRFDNNSNPGRRRLLAGSYNDPAFGKVSATAIFQLLLAASNNVPQDAVFDSIAFSFVPSYQYGMDLTEPFSISAHKIRPEARMIDSTYLTTTPVPFFEEEISEHRSFTKLVDSLTYQVRLKDELGIDILNKLKNKAPEVASSFEFAKYFKGLAFVPKSTSGVIGFNPHPSFSNIRIYYKAKDEENKLTQRSYTLSVGGVSYSNISSDRNGTALNNIQPFTDFITDDEYTYIQAGTGIVTKIDLSSITQFIEGNKNIIINAAKLEIESEGSPSKALAIPSGLVLYVANNHNKLIRNPGNTIIPLTVGTDNTTSGTLKFDGSKNIFSAEIADYVQRVKSSKDFPTSIFIYPNLNALSVNRIKISKDKIKLKVYYTRVR